MNTKSSWVILGLVLLAVLFAPLIPNDKAIDCDDSAGAAAGCDTTSAYISVYTKYFK